MQSLPAWISLESLSNTLQKTLFVMPMFTLTVFKILLFKGRSVLTPAAQQGTGSEQVQMYFQYSEINNSYYRTSNNGPYFK